MAAAQQSSPQLESVRYEQPDERIARIVSSRAERANAQNHRLLYELNSALDHAAHDDAVRVIIIAADGKHFSSGHDLAAAGDVDLDDVGTGVAFGADQ